MYISGTEAEPVSSIAMQDDIAIGDRVAVVVAIVEQVASIT